jgi:hypothetical protein
VSGYAAAARIRGAAPHLVEAGRDGWVPAVTIAAPPVEDSPVVVPGPGDTMAAPGPTLAERWISFRERWSQLTFYVLDAESWR